MKVFILNVQPLRGCGVLVFRFPAFHTELLKLNPSGVIRCRN
jgi:hypothetical protein